MHQTSKSLALALLSSAAFALSQPVAGFDFSPGNWMNPGSWFGGNRGDDYYRGGPQGYYAPAPGYYQAPPPAYGYAQPAYQAPAYGGQPTYQAPMQPYAAQPAYQPPAYQAPTYQAPATSVRQPAQATQPAPASPQPTRRAAQPAYPPVVEPLPGSGGYVPEGYLSEIPDDYSGGGYVPEGYMADVPDDAAAARSGYPPLEEPAGQTEAYAPEGYSAAGQ